MFGFHVYPSLHLRHTVKSYEGTKQLAIDVTVPGQAPATIKPLSHSMHPALL